MTSDLDAYLSTRSDDPVTRAMGDAKREPSPVVVGRIALGLGGEGHAAREVIADLEKARAGHRASANRFDEFASEREGGCAVAIPAQHLARVTNMAIRVGRGTETMRNLARELEPYGVVRRES